MKQQGELVELKFMEKAYELGAIVSKPFGDNAKYDLITDLNGCKRIQVKSTSCIKTDSKQGYSILCASGCKSKIAYDKMQIDLIAAYVIPENTWYLIPVEELGGSKRINLYPAVKNNNGKYEKFKNRWDLI